MIYHEKSPTTETYILQKRPIFHYIDNCILLYSQLYFTIQSIIFYYLVPCSAADWSGERADRGLVNYILLYSQLYFTIQSIILYYIVNFILPCSQLYFTIYSQLYFTPRVVYGSGSAGLLYSQFYFTIQSIIFTIQSITFYYIVNSILLFSQLYFTIQVANMVLQAHYIVKYN